MASNQYQSALEQARSEIKGMLNDFNEVDKKILQIAANAAKIGKTDFSGGSPKELNERLQKNATYRKQVNAEMKEAERLNKALAAAQAKFYSAQSGTNKQLQQTRFETNQINKLQREAAVLNSQLATQYQKTSAELNKMRREYKDLAIQEELEIKLTKEQIAEKDRLRDQIERYDKALKKVDADTGQYNRNVGNYKSGWDGLGVSVQQIAREMPAFANSMQTGFMAISNNIPMLVDQINLLKAANKELAATGQPTQSVFKQLAGAVFNWQTLISVGVTLLTVYGAKLVEAGKGMLNLSDASKRASENIKIINDEAAKIASQSIPQFLGLVNASRDLTRTEVERKNAMEEIKSIYPDFNAEILKERDNQALVNQEIQEYIENINKKAKAQAAMNIAQEHYNELILLENEENQLRQASTKQELADLEEYKRRSQEANLTIDQRRAINRLLTIETRKIIQNEKEQASVQQEINDLLLIYSENADFATSKKENYNETTSNGLQALAGSVGAMELLIAKLEEEQSKLAVNSKAWWEYENRLEDARQGLVKLKTEYEGIQVLFEQEGDVEFDPFDYDKMTESQKEAYNQLLENAKKAKDELAKINDEIRVDDQKTADEKLEKFKQVFNEISNVAQDNLNNLQEVFNGIFQARINALENQQARNDEYYNSLLANERLTAEQRDEIEQERAEKELILQRKIREERRKQAIADKAFAIADIVINTARAVIATLGETGFFGTPLAAIVSAIGAAQIAVVASTPIPALEQGDLTGKHEGLVQINDARGSQFKEIIQRANGEMEVYGGRNVLIDKKRGDKVYKAGTAPAGYDYNDIMNASINMSLADQHGRLSQAEARQSFDMEIISNMLDKKLSEQVKAIRSVKINNTINNKSSDFASYRAAKFKRRA